MTMSNENGFLRSMLLSTLPLPRKLNPGFSKPLPPNFNVVGHDLHRWFLLMNPGVDQKLESTLRLGGRGANQKPGLSFRGSWYLQHYTLGLQRASRHCVSEHLRWVGNIEIRRRDLCGVSEMRRNCQVLLNLFRQPPHRTNLIHAANTSKQPGSLTFGTVLSSLGVSAMGRRGT